MPTILPAGSRLTIQVPPQSSVTITPATASSARVARLPATAGSSAAPVTVVISAATKYTAGKVTPLIIDVSCTAGSVTIGDPVLIDEVYDPAAVAITGGSISATMNGGSIGQTTPIPVKSSNLAAAYTDSSGTPGSVTNSSPRGRAAIPAGATSITVTSTLVTAASAIFAQMRSSDATMIEISAVAAAGSFTVTGNSAATGVVPFDFLVIN